MNRSFNFPGKFVRKHVRFFVNTRNNLIGWSDRNFDPCKRYFEHESFVSRNRLRARRWSKFNRSDPRQSCTCKYIRKWLAYRQINCSLFSFSSESNIIELVNILKAHNSILIRCTKFGSLWNVCKYIGAISKYIVKEKRHWVLFLSFEPFQLNNISHST